MFSNVVFTDLDVLVGDAVLDLEQQFVDDHTERVVEPAGEAHLRPRVRQEGRRHRRQVHRGRAVTLQVRGQRSQGSYTGHRVSGA